MYNILIPPGVRDITNVDARELSTRDLLFSSPRAKMIEEGVLKLFFEKNDSDDVFETHPLRSSRGRF